MPMANPSSIRICLLLPVKIVDIVVVLPLAVHDLDVPAGEILGVDHVRGPFGGSEQQQILERNIAAGVDQVTPGAGPMRVLHDPIGVSCLSVCRVGCEVIPQRRIALHIDAASSIQAGILDMVEDHLGPERPGLGRRPGGLGRGGVIHHLAGPPDQSVRVHVKLDVALHEQCARHVDRPWESRALRLRAWRRRR